jgi:hypothetical protein
MTRSSVMCAISTVFLHAGGVSSAEEGAAVAGRPGPSQGRARREWRSPQLGVYKTHAQEPACHGHLATYCTHTIGWVNCELVNGDAPASANLCLVGNQSSTEYLFIVQRM